MSTPNDRIAALEAAVAELRKSVSVAAGINMAALVTTLDRLVDDKIVPHESRAAIWRELQKDLNTARTVSEPAYSGAIRAIPPEWRVSKTVVTRTAPGRIPKDVLSTRPPKP